MSLDRLEAGLRIVRIAAGTALVGILAWQAWILPDRLAKQLNHRMDLVGVQVAATRDQLVKLTDKQLADTRAQVLQRVDRTLAVTDRQVTASLARVDKVLDLTDHKVTDGLSRVDRVLTLAEGLRSDIAPVATHANRLLDAYAALPQQAAQSDAWLALKPELTCRQADGTGYGGCWHSRITGLLGEAVNVGGVFTRRFPSFVDSTTGIAADVHGWTQKYVAPHPLSTKGKVVAVGKVAAGLGTAALRGGLF